MNIAIFSLIGVFVGALLQYFFTRHLENQRHLRELKTKAYTDYMLCVCQLATVGTQGGEDAAYGLNTRTADAKSRICLYASSEIIEAFSRFELLGATMNTPEQRKAFTNMVALMRKDSGASEAVNLGNIETVLLGVDSNAP